MIFATEHAIENIIAGKKTQTRRLVKEGDVCNSGCKTVWKRQGGTKIKWQVGKVYAVQSGRGKPCIYKCIHCNETALLAPQLNGKNQGWLDLDGSYKWGSAEHNFQPLRIRITSLEKQHLLDIEESNARKEGFVNRYDFLKAFYEINSRNYKDFLKKNDGEWNPSVWVLEFEVIE